MRFLHTSDWHLGRHLHGLSLHDAHQAFIDHLVEIARSEQVDAVLIAGDLYDRAVPPPDAVGLWDQAQTRLVLEARTQVVVIAGNHDSPARLGVSSRLLERSGVHVRVGTGAVGAPVLLEDEHTAVACYPVPFLEPASAVADWGLEDRGHAAALRAAMGRVRSDLAGRPGHRSVVMAHAFVFGGQGCDTERDISVGGVQHVPSAVFDGVDYVALGHLHGRQRLADGLRYSGSPLAFSFSEAAHVKSSYLVDLDADGLRRVEEVPAPIPRRMARLTGSVEELLNSPAYSAYEQCWVEATLTDAVRPLSPHERLKRRFPHLLKLVVPSLTADLGSRDLADLDRLAPVEVALDFVTEVRGRPADGDEVALLHRTFDELRRLEATR
ncbi:exonuclease SbcCD subunit D [Micromonospora echinospora]|uniref:Nuclease SbcCD subunit D n=1 Tax=Micromonospora echinospora TaxID=1877 RepID=A0A1C5A5C0_MICEC|nr:exonuclease SbcCD subunit D [Micromonospora echinospora]OZV75369.1 exonuclease SbcCD subunit D [Micromonospora echinospora]SCF40356.1 Exodeoxyribonuclease I subunit D [Micromonospora echinospora]